MPTNPSETSAKSSRGKDQIHWPDSVWNALDHALIHEMMRTRVVAKFLPQVHVDKKQTTVASDVVIIPLLGGALGAAGGTPGALSVDETRTTPINEYSVQFQLSPTQAEAEAHEETAISNLAAAGQVHDAAAASPAQESADSGDHHAPVAASHHHMASSQHRASTGVSLTMRAANLLAQAEDLVLLNGINAVNNSPLFTSKIVQVLSQQITTNLDPGLLQIDQNGKILLPGTQVVQVHPTVIGAVGPPVVIPLYREATLNAVAEGVSILQGLGFYENYALVLSTQPYADIHQALATTLIEPVEPISHLVKAGIFGTGTLPPFVPAGANVTSKQQGLPTSISDGSITAAAFTANPVLFTGVLVSLSGNSVDVVRGRMDEHLDVIVSYTQKDTAEQHQFRVVERFAERLKDQRAVVLLLFMTT